MASHDSGAGATEYGAMGGGVTQRGAVYGDADLDREIDAVLSTSGYSPNPAQQQAAEKEEAYDGDDEGVVVDAAQMTPRVLVRDDYANGMHDVRSFITRAASLRLVVHGTMEEANLTYDDLEEGDDPNIAAYLEMRLPIPYKVTEQRFVLLGLSVLMAWVSILATIVFTTAEPHRNSVYAGPAVASVAAIAVMMLCLMAVLRHRPTGRLFPFLLFVCCLGLLLGFLGVWMHTLIPVLVPVTIVLGYIFAAALSLFTIDLFTGWGFAIATNAAAVIMHLVCWLAVNQGFTNAWEPVIAVFLFTATVLANYTVFRTLHTLARRGKEPHAITATCFYAYLDPALFLVRSMTCCCYCGRPTLHGKAGTQCMGSDSCYMHPHVCFRSDRNFTEYDVERAYAPLKEDDARSVVRSNAVGGERFRYLFLTRPDTDAVQLEIGRLQGRLEDSFGRMHDVGVLDVTPRLRDRAKQQEQQSRVLQAAGMNTTFSDAARTVSAPPPPAHMHPHQAPHTD